MKANLLIATKVSISMLRREINQGIAEADFPKIRRNIQPVEFKQPCTNFRIQRTDAFLWSQSLDLTMLEIQIAIFLYQNPL